MITDYGTGSWDPSTVTPYFFDVIKIARGSQEYHKTCSVNSKYKENLYMTRRSIVERLVQTAGIENTRANFLIAETEQTESLDNYFKLRQFFPMR